MKITNTDYDLDAGFFWVEFENEKSIQCCLDHAKDDFIHIKRVIDNGGYDDGLSGDCNEWFFDEFGKDECLKLLKKESRELNIKWV